MAATAVEHKLLIDGEWVETGDWLEVRLSAVEARKLAGEVVPMDASHAGEGKFAFTLRQPLGVVGAISPFNFPLKLVAHW